MLYLSEIYPKKHRVLYKGMYNQGSIIAYNQDAFEIKVIDSARKSEKWQEAAVKSSEENFDKVFL